MRKNERELKSILQVVLKGDAPALHAKLASGVSPNEADEVGFTALMAAAKFGFEVVATRERGVSMKQIKAIIDAKGISHGVLPLMLMIIDK